MLNQLVVVGRLVSTPEEKEGETKIILATPRHFKNENGEYDTDFIPFTLKGMLASNTIEYCKKGDLVGVKGIVVGENGMIELVAEKITFLSSKKEDEK